MGLFFVYDLTADALSTKVEFSMTKGAKSVDLPVPEGSGELVLIFSKGWTAAVTSKIGEYSALESC